MMSVITLETCWTVDVRWNGGFPYWAASRWLLLLVIYFFICNFTVADSNIIFWYIQLIFPTVALWQWMIIPHNVGITLFRVALIVVLCKITEAYKLHQKIPKIFGSWYYANVTTIIIFEMFCGLATTRILRLNDRICLCFYGINPSYSFQWKKDTRVRVRARACACVCVCVCAKHLFLMYRFSVCINLPVITLRFTALLWW